MTNVARMVAHRRRIPHARLIDQYQAAHSLPWVRAGRDYSGLIFGLSCFALPIGGFIAGIVQYVR